MIECHTNIFTSEASGENYLEFPTCGRKWCYMNRPQHHAGRENYAVVMA